MQGENGGGSDECNGGGSREYGGKLGARRGEIRALMWALPDVGPPNKQPQWLAPPDPLSHHNLVGEAVREQLRRLRQVAR